MNIVKSRKSKTSVWSDAMIKEFINDCNSGEYTQLQLGAKYGISDPTVRKLARELGCYRPGGKNKIWPAEVKETVRMLYPDHSNKFIVDEVSRVHGVSITRHAMVNLAYYEGWHKAEDVTREIRRKTVRIATEYAREHKEEIRQKCRAAALKNYAAERRRLVFGLEQKTAYRICMDQKLAKRKSDLRSVLKHKKNYYCERRGNVMYYDENTRRSLYMEQKYAKMFTFKPRETA